jgi:hypothetical protein
MALISLDQWLDRFGETGSESAGLPAQLTFTVEVERRRPTADRRVRDLPWPACDRRRAGSLAGGGTGHASNVGR